MDESLAAFAGKADAEFRGAVHWWLRLEQAPTDSDTLRDFSHWLGNRAAHPKAIARVEVLWQTVQASLTRMEAADALDSTADSTER